MKVERCQCGAPVVYARSASGKRATYLDAEPAGGHEDTWVDPATGEITVSHMRIASPFGRTVHVCPPRPEVSEDALPLDAEPLSEDTVSVVLAAVVAAVAKHGRPVTATEIRREVAGYPGGPGSIAVRLAMTELVTTGRARSAVIEKDHMGCGTEGIGWELVPSVVAS